FNSTPNQLLRLAMINNRVAVNNSFRILFIGQCLQYGYDSVNLSDTYPNRVRSMLSIRFPYLNFENDVRYLSHPKGLKALLNDRLLQFKPDIVVFTALAVYLAMPWRVSLLHELAPDVMHAARSFLQKIDSR